MIPFILSFDSSLTLFLYSLSHRFVLTDAIIIFFAKWSIFILLAIVGIFFLIEKREKEQIEKYFMIMNLFSVAVGMYVFNQIIGGLLFRARPFVEYDLLPLITIGREEASFPSEHTTLAFFLAMGVFYFDKKLGKFLLVLASLIAFARVLSGVHFIGDILGGVLIGIAGASLIKKFFLTKLSS